jgi:hypothetical protein
MKDRLPRHRSTVAPARAPKSAESHSARHRPLLDEVVRTPGQALDASTRRFAAPRFHHDLTGIRAHSTAGETSGGRTPVGAPDDRAERQADVAASRPSAGRAIDLDAVRIHTDEKAGELATLLNANAFTYGRHIVFGPEQFAPENPAGRDLLAHELTHVLQQTSTGPSVQRQEIPQSLRMSVNHEAMSEESLHARHDLIIATLEQFSQSTQETAMLVVEAGLIGRELARREALGAGRTFSADDIEKMQKYFVANAKKPKPRNCIDAMNDGLERLYGDPKQKLGDAVNKTMGALQKSGRAGDPRAIEFEDPKGRVSKSGALFPDKPHESVWDAVIQMAGGDVGWSVFGMGPADMSHSVTLTLDNSDPSKPVIYWSDQWKEKAGWKPFDKAGLDAEVARVTQIIWNKKDERHKPSTRVTLWRLKQNVAAPPVTP